MNCTINMKNSFPNPLLFSMVLIFILSCTNDIEEPSNSIYGRWAVSEVSSVSAIFIEAPDEEIIILDIKSDNTLELFLSTNICNGFFTLTGDDEISFNIGGCTKKCCDSDFSLFLFNMIQSTYKYSFVNDQLKLWTGSGLIKLETID